jgi:hypothetical protein
VIQRLDQVAVAIDDARGLVQVRGLDRVDRGQVAGEVIDDADGGAGAEQAAPSDDDEGEKREPPGRVARAMPLALAAIAAACPYAGASFVSGQAGTSRTLAATWAAMCGPEFTT